MGADVLVVIRGRWIAGRRLRISRSRRDAWRRRLLSRPLAGSIRWRRWVEISSASYRGVCTTKVSYAFAESVETLHFTKADQKQALNTEDDVKAKLKFVWQKGKGLQHPPFACEVIITPLLQSTAQLYYWRGLQASLQCSPVRTHAAGITGLTIFMSVC
jgi:hypothetical protein